MSKETFDFSPEFKDEMVKNYLEQRSRKTLA